MKIKLKGFQHSKPLRFGVSFITTLFLGKQISLRELVKIKLKGFQHPLMADQVIQTNLHTKKYIFLKRLLKSIGEPAWQRKFTWLPSSHLGEGKIPEK